MGSADRFALPAADAAACFAQIALGLRQHYSGLAGFELREGLYWPKAGWEQHQLNLYVGRRAGYEIAYRGRRGAHRGEVVVRPRGALNDLAKVAAAGFGAAAALLAFLLLVAEGLGWGTFVVPYPVRAYGGPHLSAGAVVVYALVPAVLLGLAAFVLAWPLTWLVHPLCRAANRAEGLPPADAFARRVRLLCHAPAEHVPGTPAATPSG